MTKISKIGISLPKIVYFLISATSAVLVSYLFGDMLVGNDVALQLLGTVFSVLSGFLIAIMTLIGEPMGAIGRSWRFYEKKREAVRKRLARHKFLFTSYILCLIIVFMYSLVRQKYPQTDIYFSYSIVGMASFCFMMSLNLPWALSETQLSRFDEIIDEKAKKN